MLACALLAGCGTTATAPPPRAESSAGDLTGVVETVTVDGSIALLRGGDVYAIVNGDSSRWEGSTVRVISGGGIMIDANGEKAEVHLVGSVDHPRTYSNTGEHSQESGSSDGGLLLLDDGSVWAVPAAERHHTRVWAEGAPVNVEPGPHGLYKLTNSSTGTTVLAAYIGEK